MFNKSFIKPILIFCTILAFTGIVYGQFTDYYERRIHNEEGYIYWEDANTQRTVQSQVRVSKYGGLLLPYVDIDEYAHCKSAEIDSQMKKNQGTFYLSTLRRGEVTFPYEGKDSKTREISKRLWFFSPGGVTVRAIAQVCPRRDSDTQKVKVEF